MIDLVRAEIDRRYTCRQGVFGALCNTDEPYVVIGIPAHGVKQPAALPGVIEASSRAMTFGSEKEACAKFLEAFNKYAKACEMLRRPGDGPLVLWWRYALPHLFMEYGQGKKRWTLDRPHFVTTCRIRGRLCLSAKPVVWENQQDYDARRYPTELEDNPDGEKHIHSQA